PLSLPRAAIRSVPALPVSHDHAGASGLAKPVADRICLLARIRADADRVDASRHPCRARPAYRRLVTGQEGREARLDPLPLTDSRVAADIACDLDAPGLGVDRRHGDDRAHRDRQLAAGICKADGGM